MTELQRENQQGVLQNTSIRYVGPADNAQDAANKIYHLSNGNSVDIELQNHADDWVGTMIGGNAATYDKIPENSSHIKEQIRILDDKPTVYSCYGAGDSEGKCLESYGNAVSRKIKAIQSK